MIPSPNLRQSPFWTPIDTLRAGDLRELAWSHVTDDAIIIPTSKSRGSRSAFVPLYHDLRLVLASIPKRSLHVLTNEKGLAWKDGVNGTSFRNARDLALPESRPAFPRSARNGRHEVPCCRAIEPRDRGDYGLGRKPG